MLVHSSLRRFGHVVGGADAVVAGLRAALGPAGTLMVPTLPFTGSQHAYLRQDPVFDVRHTPSAMGAVSEVLRRRPEARRSLHPTHSVAAVGPLAEWLLRHHEHAPTCCGLGTPYYRNIACGGYVLLLGVDLRANTTMHTLEEMEAAHYVFGADTFAARIVDWQGRERRVPTRAYRPGLARHFPAVEEELARAGVMRAGRIGAAPVRLIDAQGLCRVVGRLLRANPDLLLRRGPD